MTPLIDMLENAECGSRELDAMIALALGWQKGERDRSIITGLPMTAVEEWTAPGSNCVDLSPPGFSSSIDAALSALPAGWEYNISTLYGFATVELPLNCSDDVPPVRVTRPDCEVALALITAILKSSPTREGTDPKATGD